MRTLRTLCGRIVGRLRVWWWRCVTPPANRRLLAEWYRAPLLVWTCPGGGVIAVKCEMRALDTAAHPSVPAPATEGR